MSNYGFDFLNIGLRSDDFGWNPPAEGHKTHLLKNWKVCTKWNCSGLSSAWRNTGHVEWEYLMAGWFLAAVEEADKDKREYADITRLMETDLFARGDREFTHQQIQKHVTYVLSKVEETDTHIYWQVKEKFGYDS